MKTSQDIINFCNLHNRLYEHAFNAKNYLYMLEKIDEKQYQPSARMFSCCYTIFRNALIEALTLNLIRIYDLSSPSLTNLLNWAQKIYHDKNQFSLFNEYQHTYYDKDCTQINIPYTYFIETFDKNAKKLIDKIKNAELEIMDEQRWAKILEYEWLEHKPKMEVTANDLLVHLQEIIASKNCVIQNLKEQRNNLLIHNDQEYLDSQKEKELEATYPLYKTDMKDLTIIAFNTIMWLERIINKNDLPQDLSTPKGTQYSNQRDIDYVFNLVKNEVDIMEKKSEELEKELRGYK